MVLIKGGHAFEMLELLKYLEPYISPSFLALKEDLYIDKKVNAKSPIYRMTASLQEMRGKNIIERLWKILLLIPSMLQSFKAIWKSKAKAVIANGGGAAVAPVIVGWLLGCKIIFIESACRVKTRSLAGRASYWLFADLFIVQWEEQLKNYPKAIYAGRPF